MDSFDDLLAPSRQALEENPFADPFARRSGSPDPWASPFANTQSSNDFTTNAFATTSPVETHNEPTPAPAPAVATPTTVDPLDSAIRSRDTDDEAKEGVHEAKSPTRSPGFRESISTPLQDATEQTSSDALQKDVLGSVPTDSSRSTTPPASWVGTPSSPTSQESKQISHVNVSPDLPNTRTMDVISPLERSTPLGIDQSVAQLSFGKDSLGGWQSERTAWGGQVDDDSDDDKPIGQTVKIPEQHADNKMTSDLLGTPNKDNEIQSVFVITVDDPQKVGDPIRSFTMYTVHTRTTSPLFQKSAFSVLRRYSDFLWLYETLSLNNPGVVVPPVPEKNPFGRFDDQFVRQRRLALEKCIQKIANHPILSKDPDLKMFLESDTFALDIKHRKAEIAHERGGLMASIGQTLAGPRFHETDEWFDRQKIYLDSLESQLRGLVKAIEAVSRQRTELSAAAGEFAQTVSELSSSDVGAQLSSSLVGLADVERKVQDLQVTQADQDMVTLMSTVDEYARLINSVRLAFTSRIRTYHNWRQAESDLQRVKNNHEKNRTQGRLASDRMSYSLSQIAEAERRAMESKHEFEHVSKLAKMEVVRFEQERVEDFKDSLHAFLEGMISRQKELISAWENYQQMLLKRVGGGGSPQNISVKGLTSH